MGYSNIGSPPRFYISRSAYLMATGQDPISWAAGEWGGYEDSDGYTETLGRKILSMNPYATHPLLTNTSGSGEIDFNTHFNNTEEWGINYIAVLNHNLATKNQRIVFEAGQDGFEHGLYVTEIVNYKSASDVPTFDGFTIAKISRLNDYYKQLQVWLPNISSGLHFGAISFGKYYDCPVSPDLSLTMSHEYDGINTVKTKGGSTLSNANYHKPPKWGELDAWELQNPNVANYNPLYHMSGRRSWDLSFSFVSDKDLEPYNHSGYEWSSDTDVNIQGELPTQSDGVTRQDNFFSDVLRYTMGGHLPFIFCPDPSIVFHDTDTDDSPPRVPEFAICRFDMNTFKRTLVAHKMYSISVKVVESW